MTRQHYETRPAESETVRFVGLMATIIRFNIEEVEDGFDCDEVEYTHEKPLTEEDYGHLVSALVRAKYSADEVEAIQLNYMESKTAEHKDEWNALQTWRTKSKEAAAAVLEGLPEESVDASEMSEIEPLEMEDL